MSVNAKFQVYLCSSESSDRKLKSISCLLTITLPEYSLFVIIQNTFIKIVPNYQKQHWRVRYYFQCYFQDKIINPYKLFETFSDEYSCMKEFNLFEI